MKDILSGRCEGVWTLGPDSGHALGTIAWLTDESHAVALTFQYAEQLRFQARARQARVQETCQPPWERSVVGGAKKKGSQRSNLSMARGRIGTTEQAGGDVAVDKVDGESERDPEVEVLGDRLSSSSTPVCSAGPLSEVSTQVASTGGRRHLLDDSEGEMCEEDFSEVQQVKSAFDEPDGEEAFEFRAVCAR